MNEFEETKLNEEAPATTQEVEVPQNPNNEMEMSPNDFSGYTYLKTPKVGASIELTVKKVFKADSRKLTNNLTGKKFWTGLEDKKGNRKETILETINGERYTIDSWSLFFALFDKNCDFQKASTEKGSYDGIKIKITHNYNGKDSGSTPEDIMKIRELPTLEAAKEHIVKVSEAMADGTLYSVEVIKN